jgi:hypothetical protein
VTGLLETKELQEYPKIIDNNGAITYIDGIIGDSKNGFDIYHVVRTYEIEETNDTITGVIEKSHTNSADAIAKIDYDKLLSGNYLCRTVLNGATKNAFNDYEGEGVYLQQQSAAWDGISTDDKYCIERQKKMEQYHNKMLTSQEVIDLCKSEFNKTYVKVIDNDNNKVQLAGECISKHNGCKYLKTLDVYYPSHFNMNAQGYQKVYLYRKDMSYCKTQLSDGDVLTGKYMCRILRNSETYNIGYYFTKQ